LAEYFGAGCACPHAGIAAAINSDVNAKVRKTLVIISLQRIKDWTAFFIRDAQDPVPD
jgi:hypothetical protein